MAAELAVYLSESFGNATRIDYGTGHETNFIVFLLCLSKAGVVAQGDLRDLVLCVFPRYLRTCRRLQLECVLRGEILLPEADGMSRMHRIADTPWSQPALTGYGRLTISTVSCFSLALRSSSGTRTSCLRLRYTRKTS